MTVRPRRGRFAPITGRNPPGLVRAHRGPGARPRWRSSEASTLRTTPPVGEDTVTISLTDDGVDVAPAAAVFSFGVEAAEVERAEVSVARLEAADSAVMASCSYINAFPDAATYERWADGLSDAHAVAVGLDELLAFGRVAAGDWVVDSEAN